MAMFFLASCSDETKFKTVVNEDGSFEKTITLTSSDSILKHEEYVGVSEALNWQYKKIKEELKLDSGSQEKNYQYQHHFTKAFKDVAQYNDEQQQLDKPHLPISVTFNKRFRWFYTYFDYTETFGPINFLSTPIEDFINTQDFDFIAKLPAEGKPLSKADSVFLENLNVKISDQYGSFAYFNQISDMVLQNLKNEEARLIWKKNEKQVFKKLTDKESTNDSDVLPILDSLNIRKFLDEANFDKANKAFEEKLSYLMWASDSHYTIEIEMPGYIVKQNADSLYNNTAIWKPSSLKFLLKPYTFEVSSRKANGWAWIVSAIGILLVIGISIKRYQK